MEKSGCPICPGGHLRRRDFLRVGSLSFLGISLEQFLAFKNASASTAASVPAKAQSAIMIFLQGGQSQVDTWDPKPNSNFKTIATNVAGIQVSELLPRCAKMMDKIAIVRSMHTEENNHGQGTHYAFTGHRPNPVMNFPGLGAIVTKEMGPRNKVPPHVLMPLGGNQKAHFIGPENDPLVIPDPSQPNFELPDLSLPKGITVEQVQNRRSMLKFVDQFYRSKVRAAEFGRMDTFSAQALEMLMSPDVREAFDMSQEAEITKETYGKDKVGQSLLMARRLVEAGSRFITVSGFNGQDWDTHGDNDKRLRGDLMPPLDRSVAVLLADLEKRGLLDTTLVIVMGEFGRTAAINNISGRDHWPECWSLALAGGGIRGGQVVGASDERGAYVAERQVTMGDIFATVYKCFGIDWTKEYMHPVGRPVKIANSIDDTTGTPLHELI